MIHVYKIGLNLLFLAALPLLPVVWLWSEKRRANLFQRLGFHTGFRPKPSREKRVWIHALSVGEVRSALPVVQALKDRHSNLRIIFTASTRTGYETARHLFLGNDRKWVDQLGYFPFDLGLSVKRVATQIAPDAVVLVETDLWPNFLFEMKERQIPVVLINARLSNRSLKEYMRVKGFSAWFFSLLSHIMVQTELDRDRFLALGLDPGCISVTGNIKFDQSCEPVAENEIADLKHRLGIDSLAKIMVAGSTHEGEEEILVSVFQRVRTRFPEFILILAPRNPDRCREIKKDLEVFRQGSSLMSSMNPDLETPEIILIDRMGILSKLYALGDLAFIGGSMVKEGGHNPLEAAVFSKPILFGGDMSDFLLISRMLLENGGARQVVSAADLESEIKTLLSDPETAAQMGASNFEVFARNSGAVERIVRKMEQYHLV